MTRRIPLFAQGLNLALFGALLGLRNRTERPRHRRQETQADEPRRSRRRSVAPDS